jgi:hypothetical protein
METFKNNTSENQEMAGVIKKLEDYQSQGFLFHGSKEKIIKLEPRQAKDNNPSAVKNLNAVYSGKDFLRPIVLALLEKKDKTRSWMTYYDYSTIDTMEVKGENAIFTPGYIHILPKEGFQEIEDKKTKEKELVSYEPVEPIDILKITPEILNLIPGITYDLK